MPLTAPCGPGARPRGLVLVLLAAAGACAVAPPTPPPAPLRSLEPPALSPPGQWPAAERLAWWDERLPSLPEEDWLEARLCMGELLLELDRPQEARHAFYDVLDREITVREIARAERGLGLSHFLEGAPRLGLPHLERARPALERPAAEEVGFLIAATRGTLREPDAALAARTADFLLAAGLAAAVPQPAAAAEPARAGLVDVTRQQWGAKALQANHDPMGKPYRITVHHTAEPLSGESLPATVAEVRNIQMLHVRDRHWADIGYHFLIDRAGRVVEGRSLEVQGAHAGNSEANRGNIGVALMGNFEAQPERGPEYLRVQEPTAAQIATLDRLVAALRERYGIGAGQIWGHDHFRDTECPGARLRTWVMQARAGRAGVAKALPAAAGLTTGR